MTMDPLRMTFDVACDAEHAFATWTARISAWWPRDHTVTGKAEQIVLQDRVGGRIYERAADGTEHEWGEVTAWQPPARLAYLWYLGREPADATEVEIRFTPQGTGQTRVEITHRGWERLGQAAGPWRDRNQAAWQTLLPHYLTAITEGGT
jgi:uncharacterized protein YndB with AHSA1/START domain